MAISSYDAWLDQGLDDHMGAYDDCDEGLGDDREPEDDLVFDYSPFEDETTDAILNRRLG